MEPRTETEHRSVDGALAHADALASDGRWREAITVLVEATRTLRDGQLERRLIGLRHDAFAGIDTAPPNETGDRGGSGPDLTAIGRAADELVTEIRANGFAHRRALLTSHRVTQLVEDIDHAFSDCDVYNGGRQPPIGTQWYEPFEPGPGAVHLTRPWLRDGGGVFAADSPRTFFDLFESYEEAGVLEIVSQLLGERPVVSLDKTTLRRVGPGDGITWHQDGAFLGADVRAVNVWLSLTESGGRSLGLELVPRRLEHIVDTGTEGAEYSWSVAPSVVAATATGAAIHHPVLDSGDALFFDGFLLHRTCPGHGNECLSTRYAIETWFFAPSSYPAQQQVPLVV